MENLHIAQTSSKVTFNAAKKHIILSTDEFDNFIRLEDNFDYQLDYLSGGPGNKGGHSIVLRLISSENEIEPKIIKICSYNLENQEQRYHELRRRFQREIIALRKASKIPSQRVIKLDQTGVILVQGKKFLYYVMESADSDLTTYLNSTNLSTQQKLLVCLDLIKGLGELHAVNIYHRDIKHDNMLMCSGQCKVGDLGLVSFRSDDYQEELGERIGAFGWESPETMNKFYAEQRIRRPARNYRPAPEAVIDDKSDIFQLGKLFWYIFTGQVPIGQITYDDLVNLRDQNVYSLIYNMLLQDKNKRPDMKRVEALLIPISRKYKVI